MKNRSKGQPAPAWSIKGPRSLGRRPPGEASQAQKIHIYSDGLIPLCQVEVWEHSLTGQRLGRPQGPSKTHHGVERERDIAQGRTVTPGHSSPDRDGRCPPQY